MPISVPLLPNLMLKEPFASQFETGVTSENLAQLTHVSRLLDEILNRAPDRYAPYVGAVGLHPQGRAACLGGGEGSRRPMSMCRRNRWATSAPCRCRPSRAAPMSLANLASGRRQAAISRACCRTSSAASSKAIAMTMPQPRSNCWRCAQQNKLPGYFTVEQLQRHGGKRAATQDGDLVVPRPRRRWS